MPSLYIQPSESGKWTFTLCRPDKARVPKNRWCKSWIWKGLSEAEKFLWNQLYPRFLVRENLPPRVTINREQLRTIAHNLATQAVWALRGQR